MSFETDKAAVVAAITARRCPAASYVADSPDYATLADCILDWVDTFDRDPAYLKTLISSVSPEVLLSLGIYSGPLPANISNPFLLWGVSVPEVTLQGEREDLLIVGGRIGRVTVAGGAAIGGIALIGGASVGALHVEAGAAVRWLGIGGIKDAAPTTLKAVTGPGKVLHYGTQQHSVFGGFQNQNS